VLYGQNIIIPAGSYQLKIGAGGASNTTGQNSEGFGATVYGGATTIYTPWSTSNAGSAGGSGSGGSAGTTAQNGGCVTASIKGTILAASTVYGNAAGKSTSNSMSYGCGRGGGAGTAGNDSLWEFAPKCVNRSQYVANGLPGKGGDGIMINIFNGLDYYWGAGGGSGTYDTAGGDGGIGGVGGGGVTMSVSSGVVADIVGRGGLFGVGKATNGIGSTNSDATGGNGANHTGSGGCGAGWTSGQGGSGGSGIIIIKLKSIVPIDTITHKTLNFL
jgi:hypothetical protein